MKRNTNESKGTFEQATANLNTVLTAYIANPDSANNADGVKAMTDYATIVAYSTIRKRNDPQRKTAVDNGKTATTASGDTMCIPSGANIDSNGNAYSVGTDNKQLRSLKNDVARFVSDSLFVPNETIGDGADLVQDAYLAMLEQAQAHNDNGNVDIERTFTERKLDKHVKIRTSDNIHWKDVETSPARKIFHAVGTTVDKMQSVKSASEKYGYIALDDNDDGGTDNRLYLRYGMYSGIGGTVSHSGMSASDDGTVTADITTAEKMYHLIASLNLTARQATVLKYRLAGFGYKAIASKLGVTDATVKDAVRSIRKKAVAVGIKPDGYDK